MEAADPNSEVRLLTLPLSRHRWVGSTRWRPYRVLIGADPSRERRMEYAEYGVLNREGHESKLPSFR